MLHLKLRLTYQIRAVTELLGRPGDRGRESVYIDKNTISFSVRLNTMLPVNACNALLDQSGVSFLHPVVDEIVLCNSVLLLHYIAHSHQVVKALLQDVIHIRAI